ncbi:hypothetical protein [Xanthomonas sacchari]|uniref:hypothetical protein n=1 Tax=Xanthomonas sacchari TaxID=56458 RepID=UPI00225E0113|nr:hypothetical protein [Xanthomonas sacchari]MCW0422201.1 hypothetical protein [Xanthomonas sacchari]
MNVIFLRDRRLWILFAALAFLLVSCAQYNFIWNHFYSRGPYLLDSGWYSSIIYKAGFFPENPFVAHSSGRYFDIHVSFLVSILSVLSGYLPFDRVDWFAITQGAMYGSLVLAPACLAWMWLRDCQSTRQRRLIELMGIIIVAATTFSGQVLMCWGYPHYEIFIPAMINLALVAWLAERHGAASVCLLIAAASREDGGFHGALAFGGVWLGLLAYGFRSSGFFKKNLDVLGLAFFSFFLGVVFLGLQKMVFDGHSLLREEYLGDPLYAHLSVGVIRERVQNFLLNCRFLWYPILVALGGAVLLRNVLPILGWIAYLPWLLLNLFAVQEIKAEFSIYTGFPFVVAMFLPLIAVQRLRSTGLAASTGRAVVVCAVLSVLASTIGFARDKPAAFAQILRDSVSRAPVSESNTQRGLRAFTESMSGRNFYYDQAMAAWLIDQPLPANGLLASGRDLLDRKPLPVLYSSEGMWRDDIVRSLSSMGKEDVWLVPDSILRAWLPAGETLPAPWVRGNLTAEMLQTGQGVVVRGVNFDVTDRAGKGFAIWGPFQPMPAGTYRVTWRIVDARSLSGPEIGILDVASAGDVLARRPLKINEDGQITIDFIVPPGGAKAVEFRYWHHGNGVLTLHFERLEKMPDARVSQNASNGA